MATYAGLIDFLAAAHWDARDGDIWDDGAIVAFFSPGTATGKAVWQDRAKTLPTVAGLEQTTLGSDGTVTLFGDGTYDVKIYDSADTGLSTPLKTFSSVSFGEPFTGTTLPALGVETIAALRLLSESSGYADLTNIILQGHSSAGDGGGGLFYWDSSSTATDNGGTIIKVTAVTTGRWLRLYSGRIDLAWFGAIGGGINIDAILAAIPAEEVVVKFGTHAITSSFSFTKKVTMLGASKFNIATGVTVAFEDEFEASLDQHFALTGTGVVTFDYEKISHGYAEWWGALPGNNTVDNTTWFTQAMNALPKVVMMPADYWITTTYTINKSHFTLEGAGIHHQDDTNVSRFIMYDNATDDIIYVYGDTATPTTPNTFLQGVHLRDFQVTRTSMTPPASGQELTGPTGIRWQYTLYSYADRIKATENYIGQAFTGNVDLHISDCVSFRSLEATTDTNDAFYGFWADGTASIGLAGGNGSLYINDCYASVGGDPTTLGSKIRYGFFLNRGYVDTYLFRSHSSQMTIGVYCKGWATTGTTAQKRSGNVDTFIDSPINDTFREYGIKIEEHAAPGAIHIDGGYGAPNASYSGVAGIYVLNSLGNVTIDGYQHVGWPLETCKGLYIKDSNLVASIGNMWHDSDAPIDLDGANNCRIMDSIRADSNTSATQAAVQLSTSDRNYIACTVTAAQSTYPEGVELLSTTSTYNEINCTLIDPSAIDGGANDKLVYNGGQITTVVAFGTGNLSAGVMS